MEGLQSYVQNIEYCPGAYGHQLQPLLGPYVKTSPGIVVTFYNDPHTSPDRTALEVVNVADSSFQLLDYKPPGANPVFYASMTGYLTPEKTGVWDLGVMCHGTELLYINGKLVLIIAPSNEREGHSLGAERWKSLGLSNFGQARHTISTWSGAMHAPRSFKDLVLLHCQTAVLAWAGVQELMQSWLLMKQFRWRKARNASSSLLVST